MDWFCLVRTWLSVSDTLMFTYLQDLPDILEGAGFNVAVADRWLEGHPGEFKWTVTVALDNAFVENINGGFDWQAFSEGFALGGQP